MDTPPVPKPRSAFLPQSQPVTRPVPLPRTKLPVNDRVTASDIFRSISSVSKQLTEDVATKVSHSAKTANEKIEKSIIDGSKFAKGTLEKTLNTSRAVRDSVAKSVIEGTRTAGLKLRRSRKAENAEDAEQRCVSMPVVDVSLFDNIQFHSPLLEQKRFINDESHKGQDIPSVNLSATHFDDMSLFSNNSDTNTDSVSIISHDSRDYDNSNEHLTYDTPRPSRTNSVVSTMSFPEVPERRKKRESAELMRQNSMYENWTLPFQSQPNTPSPVEVTPRPSKSTIYEFDPLHTTSSSPKYQGVSNELLLLESFLIGDTYGTIVSNDCHEDSFEFDESEYFNPPTPPERFDSLFPNKPQQTDQDKDRNSNWFVATDDTKPPPEEEPRPSHSVLHKFSRKLKLDNVLHKSQKQPVQKVEAVERPPIHTTSVPYFSGTLTRIVSNVVEDLFKNSQTRYCMLSDQKLICYSDATNCILKEAYTLDSIYSLQIVLPLSSSTTSNSYCFELSVSSGGHKSTPRKVLFSCASASERRNWAQKIAEHLTNGFPAKYTAEFTRCGWCYLKVSAQ
ncbi:hypothetical protein O3G_MSEX003468 [Manduca sexta]|uniref:PH domain-containing protein n=1 Tax=Manduca sexta TaxID=7130 RepID=A0A921YST7_MANSE|nr:hypothetical protein O3G_MSEX003468 [Manduca sexta]